MTHIIRGDSVIRFRFIEPQSTTDKQQWIEVLFVVVVILDCLVENYKLIQQNGHMRRGMFIRETLYAF